MIKFYFALLNYLRSDFRGIDTIEDILSLYSACGEKSPSWVATEESINLLDQCCNEPESIENDDLLFAIQNNFIKAAFRDLSPIRDPRAMNTFQYLARHISGTYGAGEDMLIWARNVKERPDGSAIISLHVTNLERYRALTEDHDLVDHVGEEEGTLEECILIGS